MTALHTVRRAQRAPNADPSAPAMREYLDAVILVLPLALGFVSAPYGSQAIIGVLIWFGLPRLSRILRADTVDILVAISALIVFVSPYWHGPPSETARSAALGAALGVAYFLPVKWVVQQSASHMIKLARVLVLLGTGLSVFTLTGGIATQVAGTMGSRLFVDFANANYAAAALATTASVTILLAAGHVPTVRRRTLYLAALCVQAVTIYQLGSRAALAGVVMAALIVLFFTRRPRGARTMVFAVLVGAFISGWLPKQFAAMLTVLADPLSQFESLGRSQTALLDASGRLQLWESTIHSIEQSPLVGWGPGTYADLFNIASIPAHAWGLEYVASVGIVGAVFVSLAAWLSYWKSWRTASRGALWNAATAVALVPSLALSTHQWNAWAWMVTALWACSHILDKGFPSLSVDTQRGKTTGTGYGNANPNPNSTNTDAVTPAVPLVSTARKRI